MEEARVIAWFSCGAASAVAAKMAVEKYGGRCTVVYCDTSKDEHPDNLRFLMDVENWIGAKVQIINNPKYTSVDDVFEQERYMSGINGARCTTEMKKIPRFFFQEPDDVHIFGFTSDESKRIEKFKKNNPELICDFILEYSGVTKELCYSALVKAGINLPKMYMLGYKNNNCIGCVKAQGGRYWNMIRRDFPEVFSKRVAQSRELGVRLVRFKGERIFLDELPPDYLSGELEDISCGPDCNPNS